MNDTLYSMMLSLCPAEWKFIKVLDSTAENYLDYIFDENFETEWVFNMDEDCFLFNYPAVEKMIDYMEDNGFDYSGVQDGGTIPVRIHNPLVSNPFFNLFNNKKIKALEKNYYQKKYAPGDIADRYSHLVKYKKTPYKYDFYEPFYSHFFWLLENNLKPLFLNATPYDKERYFVFAPILRIVPYFNSPTMLHDHEDKPVALHTWHSRYYNYANIRKRINNCYSYARERSDIGDAKKDVKIVRM